MDDFIILKNSLRKLIHERDPKQEIGFYEFNFPQSGNFNKWISHMLDTPSSWRGWISKTNPNALFNQIIQKEKVTTRTFPPNTPEDTYGIYVISDENQVLYIGKSQDSNNAVIWRLIDHLFPFLPYAYAYRNIYRMQNTPWFWDMHINENKKLYIFYCDNMTGVLKPKDAENYLRKLFKKMYGDYPKYDGYSKFSKQEEYKSGLTFKEYKNFINWCYSNPEQVKNTKKDGNMSLIELWKKTL